MAFVRKIATFSSILVGLCCLLYIAAWSLVQTRYFQSWLETSLGNRGVDLRVAGLTPVFPFGLIVSSAEITVPGQLHFTSKKIRANLNPLALMFGQLEELNLLEPNIRVQRTSSSKRGASSPINLLVRSFTVEDGRVEVETGNGKSIAIPRIELRGENLNLGSQSGELETTAFVPELNSDLKISLRASPAEIEASLELLQHKSPGTGAISQIEPKGQGQVTLHFEPDATLRLKGHAALQQVVVNGVRYTGAFDFLAQTDSHRETIAAEVQSELTQLAGLTLGTDITPTLPLSIRIKGQFTTTDNHLSLTQIRLHSPLGTVNGKAVVALDPKPQITSALFETQNLALSKLQALLPNGSPGNLDGRLTGTLNVQGNLAPWSFSGVLATTATNIAQSNARIGQLKGTIPFTLDAAQFTATGFELSAEKLDVNLPGQELKAGIASLGIKGDLHRAPKKAPRFNGTIDLRGGSFTTADGLAAAESIGGKASIRLVMEPDGTSRAELNVQLDTMELLWNRFFGDFKAQQPRLSLSARYDSRNETLQMENGRFSLSRIGDLEFKGRLERLENNPFFDIRIQTPRWHLNKFYDFFIRETFTTSLPLLGELQLSGAAIAETVVRGVPERFSVEGTLQLRGTKLSRPDRWSVGPVEFALPFKLDYPQRQPAAAATQVPRAGIAVRRIRFGASEIPPFTLFVSLWDNGLTLLRPLHIPIYGGALIVERLAWPDIVASPRDFSFSAKVDDISLATLTREQGWYEFDGNLSGVIPQIKWSNDAFQTNGRLELQVFQGTVTLDGLEVSRLDGSVPAIKGNLGLRNIDLAQATQAFELGSISGTLEGTIEDLIVSGGQPSQFRASFETVKGRGVSQWISVEALNEIAVLSSGAQGNALYGTLAGFFDSYRYRKLGFKARLRNDLLLLQGIKSNGGQEFLVEGSRIPPTVNIVSHTQRIGFAELIKRLERIR